MVGKDPRAVLIIGFNPVNSRRIDLEYEPLTFTGINFPAVPNQMYQSRLGQIYVQMGICIKF